MTPLILASESPRRRALLSLLGYPFEVQAAHVDETSVTIPDPAQNSLETARLKAHAVDAKLLGQRDGEQNAPLILAADTTVALGEAMFGKPTDAADASRMLEALRSRDHEVHTGMVLLDTRTGQELTAIHTAVVTMRPYTNREIEQYIASGDPYDKAGAYAIQHAVFRPVKHLQGCFPSVMGLCVCQLYGLLEEAGYPAAVDLDALTAAHNGFPCALLDNLAPKRGK